MDDYNQMLMQREGGNVVRCHIFPTIRKQTNGHHSYNAANLYLQFHPDPQLETVKEILLHDVAERGAGDTPAPAKVARPGLRFEYEELEAQIRTRFGLDTCIRTDEQEWVNACDLIEFLLFMFEERLMGNQYSAPKIKAVSKYLETSLNNGNIPAELDGIISTILRYGVKPLTDNLILGIMEE